MKIDTLTPFQSTYGAHSKMSSLVLPFSMLKWPSLHTCYSRPIQLFKSLSSLLTKLRTMSEEKEVLLHAQASFRTGVGCTIYFRYFKIRSKSSHKIFVTYSVHRAFHHTRVGKKYKNLRNFHFMQSRTKISSFAQASFRTVVGCTMHFRSFTFI